jgi:excisionase family DNA binding protein
VEISNLSDPLVLTPVETAKVLRIGRGTVYEQIRLGVIPSVKMGRKILIPKVALLKMLEAAKGAHPQMPSPGGLDLAKTQNNKPRYLEEL